MRVTYHGHSCFRLEVPGTVPVRLVFDPFLRDNPHGAVDPATQRAVEDAILTRARELRIRDGKL